MSSPSNFICEGCSKSFKRKYHFTKHVQKCLHYRIHQLSLETISLQSKLNEYTQKEKTVVLQPLPVAVTTKVELDTNKHLNEKIQQHFSSLFVTFEALLCFSSIEETCFTFKYTLNKYSLLSIFLTLCNEYNYTYTQLFKEILKLHLCFCFPSPTKTETIAFSLLDSNEYPFSFPNQLKEYHEKIKWLYQSSPDSHSFESIVNDELLNL